MPVTEEEQHFRDTVALKDPVLAGFLAWLIPGLGHLYQGRRGKAGVFFVCILGTFVWGLYLGSDTTTEDPDKNVGLARVVYASWRDGDKRLPYLCQVWVGLPALPALVQAVRVREGKEVWLNGFMAPPLMGNEVSGQPSADEIHKRLHPYYELGKVYTMIAGLLNILAIFDACCGPVFGAVPKKDEEEKDTEDEEKGKDSPQDSASEPS